MKPLIGFFSPHMVTNLAPRLRAPELHDSASPLCWPNSSFTFTLFTHHFITLAARVNHSTALSAVYLCIYLRTLILDIYALALPKNYSCYFFMVFFIVYFVGVYILFFICYDAVAFKLYSGWFKTVRFFSENTNM